MSCRRDKDNWVTDSHIKTITVIKSGRDKNKVFKFLNKTNDFNFAIELENRVELLVGC